jgi:hypothetical protein
VVLVELVTLPLHLLVKVIMVEQVLVVHFMEEEEVEVHLL